MPNPEIKGLLFVLVLSLLLGTSVSAAVTNGDESAQPRYTSISALDTTTLYNMNKFPTRVDTVKDCSQNADPETKLYCALIQAAPSLFQSSVLEINLVVNYGPKSLQSISKSPKTLHPQKDTSTATQYAFDSSGDGYNAIFLDQGTLYVNVADLSTDTATAIIKHLYDESYAFKLNAECIIRTSTNAKALAFKNCQVLDAAKTPLDKLDVKKIECTKPAKTGIIAITQPINGQCPATVPNSGQTAALQPAGKGTLDSDQTPNSNPGECNAADFDPPINDPKPRADDSHGNYWFGDPSNNQAGHHEGVDIIGEVGKTKIMAIGPGIVEKYETTFCGNAVLIKHDCTINGKVFRTKYCHLDKTSKKPAVGSQVTKGQTLGLVGKTGNAANSDVPHLHIEYNAGGTFTLGQPSKGGDFDPVAKGFMPATFNKPSSGTRVASPQGITLLDFAGSEQLPTIQEYIQNTFPNAGEFKAGSRHNPKSTNFNPDPCLATNPDDDANGFFGYRNRGTAAKPNPGCVHAGIDIRGIKAGIGGKPVKAMLSGKISIVKPQYQIQTDCAIIVDSGDWVVSYGHVQLDEYCDTKRIGEQISAGQEIAKIATQLSPSNGNELDIKMLYKGNVPELKALTIQQLKSNTNPPYSKYFKRYPETKTIFAAKDFTFDVPNYDDYFLWEAYSTSLKVKSAVTPSTPTPSKGTQKPTPPNTQTPTTATNTDTPVTDTLSQLCVYYYIDSTDGAKDKFFDVGFAAYAGEGGACIVGRAGAQKPGITYPSGYTAYVNTAQLPESESYEGCYLAKMPLNKHGADYPTGAVVKLFLSKSADVFKETGPAMLDKGIVRTEASAMKIGNPVCGVQKTTKGPVVDNGEAGKKFLEYAMELKGIPYALCDTCIPDGVACATIPMYAYTKMIAAGYTLPQEFYNLAKKEKVPFKGKEVKNPANAGVWMDIINIPDMTQLPKKIQLPSNAYPKSLHNSDTWGGAAEILGWEVSKQNAKPGDLVVFNRPTGQCSGETTDEQPYDAQGCWKRESHIEIVYANDGGKISTFGSGSRPGQGPPARIKTDRSDGFKYFHIPWIAPGGIQTKGGSGQAVAGGCTDAGLAAKLKEYELTIETSINGRSTLRDLSDWKPKIQTYSKRHYGEDTADLTPTIIVEHFTVSSSFAWNLVTASSLAGEAPGEASHFEVDGKNIYQILPINVRSRGTFGANHKSVNIEMVAKTAEDLAAKTQTLDTASKLTAALMAQCAIPLEKVFSHESFNGGKKTNSEYKDNTASDYGSETRTDPGDNNLKTMKGKISQLGALTPVEGRGGAEGGGGSGGGAVSVDVNQVRVFNTADCVSQAKSCGSTDYDCMLKKAAELAHIDSRINTAVAMTESGGNTRNYKLDALSSAGAQGIMQLMPGTASGQGVTNRLDPYQNICGGTRYIAYQLKRYGSIECAFASYDAGSVSNKDSNSCAKTAYTIKTMNNMKMA
ncbi:peptidoglycan DD-metalloendopeptidase family protein [Candidatus Micrarchaeota archaeon]|nr:peptidoglycan DD-metalloendopeptidase family protein [Candidatus Micrarchaeota archaeon]